MNGALHLTGAPPGPALFPGQLVLGLAGAVLLGAAPAQDLAGRRVGGGLQLLGDEVQVRNRFQ